MTSKTFRCVEHEEEVLEVYPFTGEEGGRKFSLLMPHVSSNAGIAFDSTTAPALALAILEAAGVTETDSPYMQEAADNLRAYILIEEKVAAEAEAQAKLEAEALKFYFAFHSAVDRPCQDWDYLDQQDKQQWLAVARRAREINKETPNA